jgi:hypothetical protein
VTVGAYKEFIQKQPKKAGEPMNAPQVKTSNPPLTLNDALINGLLSGILAGAIMLVFLFLVGLLNGTSLTETLLRFSIPGQPSSPITSLLMHLGMSSVYGAFYGMLYKLVPRIPKAGPARWLSGAVFGLLLYLFATLLLLPNFESSLADISSPVFLTAHLAYGLVLGHFTRV